MFFDKFRNKIAMNFKISFKPKGRLLGVGGKIGLVKNKIRLSNALRGMSISKEWPNWWPVTSFAMQTGKEENPYLRNRYSDPPSYIVKIALVLNFKTKLADGDEKSDWAIPIKYKGEKWVLSDSKRSSWFLEGPADPKDLASEICKKLIAASKILDKMLACEFKELASQDEFYIQNRYFDVDRFYRYYREKAEEVLSLMENSRRPDNAGNGGGFSLGAVFRNFRDLESLTISAIVFFFAKTEAILDSCFALSDRKGLSFEVFRRIDWADRVKHFVKVNSDNELNQTFSELVYIKTHYRNRIVHAAPELLFSIPNIGLVPESFERYSEPHMGLFSRITEESVKRIFEVFDYFETRIESIESTRYGFEYAKSGLAIPLYKKEVQLLRNAMRNLEDFRSLLESRREQQDAFDNMEI
jgi:hypothetical protein